MLLTDAFEDSSEEGDKSEGVTLCREMSRCSELEEESEERVACESACLDQCFETCAEDAKTVFDGGFFMSSILGKYFASGGKWFEMNFCESTRSCEGDQAKPPLPHTRQ